ncbi:MAG: hypothetical protein JO249_01475 [Acidobacteria bacterium]|nr:hypothetical protein [Acidobacteriota bacterium]
MRLLGAILIILGSLAVLARERETIEQLKARADNAAPKDRVILALRVAERQADAADKFYAAGKVDEARAAIQDVVLYTEKAGDAASQSGKKLKNAEITVRQIAHKLNDMKRTLNFEDQAPVDEAIAHLEHVRTELLSKMFDLGKSSQ